MYFSELQLRGTEWKYSLTPSILVTLSGSGEIKRYTCIINFNLAIAILMIKLFNLDGFMLYEHQISN